MGIVRWIWELLRGKTEGVSLPGWEEVKAEVEALIPELVRHRGITVSVGVPPPPERPRRYCDYIVILNLGWMSQPVGGAGMANASAFAMALQDWHESKTGPLPKLVGTATLELVHRARHAHLCP